MPEMEKEKEVKAVKPCCVCLEEKSKRDQCMLTTDAEDPALGCTDIISAYKQCMRGYGFRV